MEVTIAKTSLVGGNGRIDTSPLCRPGEATIAFGTEQSNLLFVCFPLLLPFYDRGLSRFCPEKKMAF